MSVASKEIDRFLRWRIGAFYIAIFVVFVLPALLWVWFFVFSHTRTRIEHEHGIKLPASATHFECGGDAWGILDRGASSVFEIPSMDLPTFIAQLNTNLGYNTFIPGNPEYYNLSKPWASEAKPISSYACASPVGDWMHVEVYSLNKTNVAVWLYTDWN